MALNRHLGSTENHIRKRLPQRTSLGGKLASPGLMKQWGLGMEAFHGRFLIQRRKGRGSGSASEAEFCWDSADF